jgi:isopentenyldiphosphate isomerase
VRRAGEINKELLIQLQEIVQTRYRQRSYLYLYEYEEQVWCSPWMEHSNSKRTWFQINVVSKATKILIKSRILTKSKTTCGLILFQV